MREEGVEGSEVSLGGVAEVLPLAQGVVGGGVPQEACHQDAINSNHSSLTSLKSSDDYIMKEL